MTAFSDAKWVRVVGGTIIAVLCVLAALLFLAFVNGVIEDYAQYTLRHLPYGCTVEQQAPNGECQ